MDVATEEMSGLISVTGESGYQPVRVGTSITVMGAAMYDVIGVMLSHRDRERTGFGQEIEW